MSEPRHEPNPSGSDPAGGPPPGSSGGADRFWERYGEARRHRARNGANGGTGQDAGPREAGSQTEHECLEWCPICRGADVVRATAPPELRDQLEGIQRDALALIRALLDAYAARQGGAGRPADERPVEQIRID